MSIFGFCDNKCKHEVYTKDEVNTKLDEKSNAGHTHDDRYFTEAEMNTKLSIYEGYFANYKLKGDFAVATTTVQMTENGGMENYDIAYPAGFNQSNCVVLSVGLSNSFGSSWANDFHYSGISHLGVTLGSSTINGMIECVSDYGEGQTQTIKIVLMKI